MRTKKESIEFERRCGALLVCLGGKPIPDHWRPAWTLETQAGPLRCTPVDDWLATRFDDTQRACALLNPRRSWGLRLAPISGKWNFNFSEAVTVDSALEFIEAELRAVLEGAAP